MTRCKITSEVLFPVGGKSDRVLHRRRAPRGRFVVQEASLLAEAEMLREIIALKKKIFTQQATFCGLLARTGEDA